jgi:uncharacterized protein YbbC (DUF1343 family)
VSEGRGTTQPFELFGAPFVSVPALETDLARTPIGGALLRPAVFEPTAHKWQGRPCRGFQIHVTEPRRFAPYRTSLRLVQALLRRHPQEFAWRLPPYEYEHERMPIDLIIGDRSVRERLESLEPIESIEGSWRQELAEFEALRREAFLYEG